jgi:hypothetical protein
MRSHAVVCADKVCHVHAEELVLMTLDAIHARRHALHAIWVHGVWVHELGAGSPAACRGVHVRHVLDVGRELLVRMGRVVLIARLAHVLAGRGPCLCLGVCVCSLRIGLGLELSLGLHLVLHVCLELLIGVDRGGLVGHVVLLLVLGTHGLWLWLRLVRLLFFWRGVVVVVVVVVLLVVMQVFVIVAFCIELVIAKLIDDGGWGSERQSFDLDRAPLPWLVHGSELGRQASHGTAPRARRPGRERPLGCHARRRRRLALADDAPALVNQTVVVPVAEVDAVPAQLFRGICAQGDGEGRHIRGPGRPAVRFEVVNLSACIGKRHLGFPAAVVGARIAAQDLNLPVLLARAVGLVAPVAVRIGNVAEQLLRVRVEERRGGQRRVGGGHGVGVAAGGVNVVELAQALLGEQALADVLVEGVELLLARRGNGPRLGCGEGRRREEGRGRGQDVQTQRGEVERVRVEVEEGRARGLCAASC